MKSPNNIYPFILECLLQILSVFNILNFPISLPPKYFQLLSNLYPLSYFTARHLHQIHFSSSSHFILSSYFTARHLHRIHFPSSSHFGPSLCSFPSYPQGRVTFLTINHLFHLTKSFNLFITPNSISLSPRSQILVNLHLERFYRPFRYTFHRSGTFLFPKAFWFFITTTI